MMFETCPKCGGNMDLINWQDGLWQCPYCGLTVRR